MRAPDTDTSTDNTGDFTQSAGFSSNTLGTPCFLAGTLIATPSGERAVETLAVGDLLVTQDGRAVPVLWVGHKQVRRRAGVLPEALAPVRIARGALGNHSDLLVTADHGMLVDGLVINAAALVNGDTIDYAPLDALGGSFTVYHIETEGHDVILANGAPAETFIDAASRVAFDNYQEYLDLYSVERLIPPQPLPRISSARHVPPALRARLGLEAARRSA
jgi:hypothetical protein